MANLSCGSPPFFHYISFSNLSDGEFHLLKIMCTAFKTNFCVIRSSQERRLILSWRSAAGLWIRLSKT
jgi:hypothetical protein